MTAEHINVAGSCPSCFTPEGRSCSCEPVDELDALMRQLEAIAQHMGGGGLLDAEQTFTLVRAIIVMGAKLAELRRRIEQH